MVRSTYVPDRGDLVWLNFIPQSGHEQRGMRPAIVLSKESYNSKTGLALCCPITTKVKGYPFEVETRSQNVQGVILSDQVRNLDWRSRQAQLIEKASVKVTEKVIQNVELLLI